MRPPSTPRLGVLRLFLATALLLAVPAGASGQTPLSQPLALGPPDAAPQATPPVFAPTSPAPSAGSLFRDPPTITGRYALRDATVLPFVGLGFQGGETADINRQILRNGTSEFSSFLTPRFGPAPLPNEFQAGVRIPF